MKAILLTAISLLVIYLSYRAYRYVMLDKSLETKIADGATILDVRTEDEYKMGHIEGSINISLGTIRERYIELDAKKTYITTCSHGLRSVKVQSLLKEKGFKEVYNGGPWTELEKIVKKKKKI